MRIVPSAFGTDIVFTIDHGCFSTVPGILILDVQDSFPVESDETKALQKDAVGILGFKLLRLSYDTNHVSASASVDGVRKAFDSLRGEEVRRAEEAFASRRRKMRPRKSSMLRAAN